MLFCVSTISKARLEKLYEKKICHDLCGQSAGIRSGTCFFVKEWTDGRYMTGPGDGLAQMIVFKNYYLNNIPTEFFLQLFIRTRRRHIQSAWLLFFCFLSFSCGIRRRLASSSRSADWRSEYAFWAESAVFISIFKLSVIIFTAASVFHYILKHRAASFTGLFYTVSRSFISATKRIGNFSPIQ